MSNHSATSVSLPLPPVPAGVVPANREFLKKPETPLEKAQAQWVKELQVKHGSRTMRNLSKVALWGSRAVGLGATIAGFITGVGAGVGAAIGSAVALGGKATAYGLKKGSLASLEKLEEKHGIRIPQDVPAEFELKELNRLVKAYNKEHGISCTTVTGLMLSAASIGLAAAGVPLAADIVDVADNLVEGYEAVKDVAEDVSKATDQAPDALAAGKVNWVEKTAAIAPNVPDQNGFSRSAGG